MLKIVKKDELGKHGFTRNGGEWLLGGERYSLACNITSEGKELIVKTMTEKEHRVGYENVMNKVQELLEAGVIELERWEY